MNAKQKIISQAIILYNAHGVTNVTSRSIGKTLQMSHGNLEYHFPNKGMLLMAIYEQMRKEISGIYKESDDSTNPFLHFNELLLRLESFQKKYLFFNLDVLEISRNYPEIDVLLRKTFQVRKEQMTHFYERFKTYGYFKEDIKSGLYLRLQHTVHILITFWNSQQEVLPYFENKQKQNLPTYIWELLIPHMTKKGLKAYKELIQTNL